MVSKHWFARIKNKSRRRIAMSKAARLFLPTSLSARCPSYFWLEGAL